jgi:hypothetical protein
MKFISGYITGAIVGVVLGAVLGVGLAKFPEAIRDAFRG